MLLRTAQEGPSPLNSKSVRASCDMAALAKSAREVKKDEPEEIIEEATEAMGKVTDSTLRTNVTRTLESRRTSLIKSYEEWHKACGDYSSKLASTVASEQKKEDANANIKPVRKAYLEALDQLNDMIEELTKKADAQDETDKMKVDLEMQIGRATKDVELSITNHLNRSCASEVSRSAKERLFKEQERDIINPMETLKKLFMDLMKMTKDKKTREDLSGQKENWMDKTTKGIMTISDRYTNIPEIDKG